MFNNDEIIDFCIKIWFTNTFDEVIAVLVIEAIVTLSIYMNDEVTIALLCALDNGP